MNSKNKLLEGVRYTEQKDIVPSDEVLINKFNSLIDDAIKSTFIPKLNELVKHDITKIKRGKEEEFIDHMIENKTLIMPELNRHFLTEMNTLRSNGLDLMVNRKPMRSMEDVIVSADFGIEMGSPHIQVSIDLVPLIALVIVDDQEALEKVKKTYLSYVIHEWEHYLQYSKYGSEIFRLGKKVVNNMDEYIQTPLELPAWGITIGDTILRYAKSKKEALNNLRNKDRSFLYEIPKQTIVDAINFVFDSDSKNSKKLIKYAYTYILNK